jgi:hypothetical protein
VVRISATKRAAAQKPDNLKSGVKKPYYYEPELNRTYSDLAIHYGAGILPVRPYRPRDKAKAEVGVQIVQRWVLAALRKRQFFSLSELNEAILELIHELNRRPFRKLAGSRAELYQNIDRPALQPLPLAPFVYADWKKARVNLDYHIELGGHARRINWSARRWRFAAGAEPWRSSIRESALPVMCAASCMWPPRVRRTARNRIKHI